ncbi:DUF6702 family protein [Pseudoalteromonas 'SMAR']|uniref:DUF6702 family protein n=1 Tax=Pseudoalteromonas 'SMAR' TaxID=3416908 RepID=UPI003AF30A81
MKAWLIAIVVVLIAPPSFAHQLKAAITTVLFNKRTGNIEIMHRFHLHDTEHAVEGIFDDHADLFNSAEDRARFAQYVDERVAMRISPAQPLPLELVGAEIDGRFFWVYQQTPIPKQFDTLEMQHGVLRDIWPQQVNLVNFEGLDKVKSLNFNGDDNWLSVSF